MLTVWAFGRALVYLKRISKSLERIADAREVQSVPVEPLKRKLRVAEVYVPTVDSMNEFYSEDSGE